MQALPGVLNFISQAEAAGKFLAVATSADHKKFEGNVLQIGLDPSRSNVVVISEEIGNKKPAPVIFLKAGERLGLAGLVDVGGEFTRYFFRLLCEMMLCEMGLVNRSLC